MFAAGCLGQALKGLLIITGYQYSLGSVLLINEPQGGRSQDL